MFGGSYVFTKEVRRNPQFFEPLLVSLGLLMALSLFAGWSATDATMLGTIAFMMIAWSLVRQQPLVGFIVDQRGSVSNRRSQLLRSPLLALCAGFIAVGACATVVVALLGRESQSVVRARASLTCAIVLGLPLGATVWESRFGRRARGARRALSRSRRSA